MCDGARHLKSNNKISEAKEIDLKIDRNWFPLHPDLYVCRGGNLFTLSARKLQGQGQRVTVCVHKTKGKGARSPTEEKATHELHDGKLRPTSSLSQENLNGKQFQLINSIEEQISKA